MVGSTDKQTLISPESGSLLDFTKHGADKLVAEIIGKNISYCTGTNKLNIIAWAANYVKEKHLPGILIEAGVAMGGSAIVTAVLKPSGARLKLYDVFDLLPPPGKEDEERAHAVYDKFAQGVGTGQETDANYLRSISQGLLPAVISNMRFFGIEPERDKVEFVKGDFEETLFIDEKVAFAHIDCDWYRSVKCCIERVADSVVIGGIIIFDDYNSFSGAKRAVDEWLSIDSRFKVVDSRWSLIVVRDNENVGDVQAPPESPVTQKRVLSVSSVSNSEYRRRILFLVDRPEWAYDSAAKAVASRLGDEFDFKISYVVDKPDLKDSDFDLLYVFFWGESYHCSFVDDPGKVIKEISSHRWETESQYGLLTPDQMAQRYLTDAATLTCTSRRLYDIVSPIREIYFTPNGIDPDLFFDRGSRSGPLRIGWAGNSEDPCKGVNDILIPAAGQDFVITFADGSKSRQEMLEFYNSIDVLCIASTAEGEPLTLLEGMACGCFPVCVDVGIVPELVEHRRNGLVIPRSVASFRAAFQWCVSNARQVRLAGQANAGLIRSTRSWEKVIELWGQAFRAALKGKSAVSSDTASSSLQPDLGATAVTWHNNLGDTLLEWPERARLAAELVRALPYQYCDTLVDLGCGHQTLRRLLPSALTYIPVDRVARTPDTYVVNLDKQRPEGKFKIATMLGVLEYLDEPEELFCWLAGNVGYLVFSFNDCTDIDKRREQCWKSELGFRELEEMILRTGGDIRKIQHLEKNERLYVVAFSSVRPASRSGCGTKRVALFSAAVHGDNCGDALIEDSIRRILGGHEMDTFPLLKPLSPQQLDQVNSCDIAVICGTNLYQKTFACALTAEAIEKIKIPILPLGVGASAPIGMMPQMDAAGIKAVRMLHERCAVSSVRDPASLAFVRGLGISNVELTGCPVLFHAGKEPDFSQSQGNGLYLAVRARLLHVDPSLNVKEKDTLEHLIRVFQPVLVLQSPYDIPLAQGLIEKYGVQYLLDTNYSQAPLVIGVRNACRTVGFRLHFGMLSLSYGKHTTLIGTDTRVSEFCNMMGIRYHNVHSYSNEDIVKDLQAVPPPMTSFTSAWRDLRSSMAAMLKANGLSSTLTGENPVKARSCD